MTSHSLSPPRREFNTGSMTGPSPRPHPDGEFVVLDGSLLAGLMDWPALAKEAARSRLAGAAVGLLLDVRGAPFTPSTGEARPLVAALAGYRAVAIVSRGDASFGCARMVSTLVEVRGSKAAAFLTEPDAAAWLSRQVGGGPDPSVGAPGRAPA
jgi:hypothetical protein